MKRKEAVYKGLQYIPVYFQDTSLTSPDYFQITEFPTRLTAGKNLFKLRGHPTNLRVGGVLNLEVLDYNGDPIYTEVVDYIDEDKSRVIAIYIYTETSPGDCTVTLISEAQTINGQSVPQEWQGRPNLRWSRTVPVNPNVSNVSEIIFSKVPEVTVSEQVGVQLDRIYSGSQQFPTYTTGNVRLFTLNGAPAIELTGGKFTGDMQTGTITVAAPQSPTPTPNYTIISPAYTSTIKKILSDTTALLDREYTVYSSQSIFPHTYTEFAPSAYSLTYEQTPTYVATENSQSFALLQIKGLEPATGDVSRIKVYTNNKGTVGTWELVNDVELEETEIFVTSTASLFPDQSIGTFTSQSIINAYWDGFTYVGKTTGTAPTLTWSTASLNNAMNITSATDISARNAALVVQNKSAYNGVFIATSSYKVTIDALGTRDTYGLNPRLAVYVSGSAVAFDPTDYFNQELPKILGKRIGELEVTSDSQRFDDVVFNFETNYNGTAALLFVVEEGQWQIADVRTTTDNDAGYSPNYTRIRSIIETPHKANNQISFKVEYYNVDGVVSKQTSYLYDNAWQGGNRYIDGDYSMLTGSLYVADSLESGIAISGYSNSGFVRSLGYEGFDSGFPGFLLWSGSALQGQNTKGGVPYTGVGLELYLNTSSYFRYSTSDDEIYVATDNFFFGNPNGTYISGSNGNLEISSSGFVLNAAGDVTASSIVTLGPTGTVLFDSNNEFADAINIGRVVYFDQSETIIDLAQIIGGPTNAQTASIFQTYLLPGETKCQVSYTWEIANTGSTIGTIQARAYIGSASIGPISNSSYYGAFQNVDNIGNPFTISSVPAATTRSGAQTTEVTAGNTFAEYQGLYVQIYLVVYTNSINPAGTLKMKNFVWRTSREAGSSIIQPIQPIGPVGPIP